MALIEIDRSKMSKEDREFEDFARMANTKANREAFKLIDEGFRCSTGKGISKIEGNFNKNGKSTITITDTPNDPGQRMINEGLNQLLQNLLPIDKVIIKIMSSYNDHDITTIRICYNPSTGDYEVLIGNGQIFKYYLKRLLNILLSMLLYLISFIPSIIIKIIIDDIKTEFFWKEVIEIPDNKEIKYENTSIDIINVRSIDNTMVQK